MTNVAHRINLPQGSRTADQAEPLARASGDLLDFARHEMSVLLRELDVRNPLRLRLEAIEHALQIRQESNHQLAAYRDLATPGEVGQESGDQGMVALVVESHDGLRGLMSEVLSKLGYRVLEARTAEEAEREVAKAAHAVDTLVTEVLISGTSGLALGSRLRLLQPHMGIVYTVCEAHEAVVPPGMLRRATMLRKPFTVNGLSGAVREAAAA
jgi:CheY-like chemotaxis protein